MDQQRVDMYMMSNQKFFPEEKVLFLRDKLELLDDRKFNMIAGMDLKDPSTMCVISVFLGIFGIDRFMLEETGMGVLKLLTLGGLGVLALVDAVSIQKRVKEYNFKRVMRFL